MRREIRLTVLSASAASTRGAIHLDSDSTIFIRGHHGDDYVCGKCGSVLLEQVDRLMFRNAAVRCNGCGRYNDISRPARFPGSPTTLSDLEAIEPPQESFQQSTFWADSPHGQDLLELRNSLLAAWAAEQGQRPRKLYHYTSSAGLRGILGSHSLWATDMGYLNDASEMQLAINLIDEYISGVSTRIADKCRELLSRVRSRASPTDAGIGFFVMCFCANGDLLSQWRAYGASGGGYALGFSAYQFAKRGTMFVRRIIYDSKKQRELVQNTVDRTCELL